MNGVKWLYMVFLGEYEVTFTGQGRINIPKKIRESLGKDNTVVLTKGFDRCLAGFRHEDWDKGAQELLAPSLLEMDKAEIKRHLFSSAAVCEIDEQGRIVIPKNLLRYAKLEEKNMTVIGVGAHFEIWDTNEWQKYQEETEPIIKKISNKNT